MLLHKMGNILMSAAFEVPIMLTLAISNGNIIGKQRETATNLCIYPNNSIHLLHFYAIW